jgi:DNA-binding NtrC family response regulator
VPLGGGEETADVRFVATASEDLVERVERGAFRRDLFHRLEVLAFRIPPLRERRHDLPGLVDFFLDDLGARHGRHRLRLSEEAWRWMLEYRWPGNLRQLRNVLERQLVMTAQSAVLDPPPPRDVERPPRPLAEVEADTIRQTLAYTRGHQQQAADLLGISRKTLWEKRKRYDIP